MSKLDGVWLNAAQAALSKVAVEALGLAEPKLLNSGTELPSKYSGSLIPLLSEDSSTHIGLLTDSDGCITLTKALLGMDVEEEVEPSDVPDSIGEIVNMIAGGLKSQLDGTIHGIQLGLPIFVDGHIEIGESLCSEVSQVKLGDTVANLLVLTTANRS